MYGIYSGVQADGQFMFLGWVLGRDEAAVEYALRGLSKSTKLIKSDAKVSLPVKKALTP